VLVIGDLVVACPSAKHPQAAEIEAASLALAHSLDLVDEDNAARFAAFNMLTPYVYPTASVERAVTCTAWCNWLFLFDDIHDERPDGDIDRDDAQRAMHQYVALLDGGGDRGDRDPLVRLLVEFRERARSLCDDAWLARFRVSVSDYMLRGTLPALDAFGSGRPPALGQYLEQREHDSAVHTATDLIELAEGLRLPSELVHAPVTRRARRALARTVAYANDLFSYPKEVVLHENPNNLVEVLQAERGVSLADASVEAMQIVNTYARELITIEDELLAQDAPHREELARYHAGMCRWQRGNIDWSVEGIRYRGRESLFEAL
jgi:hypothetical protein